MMLPTAQCDEALANQYEWTRSWFEFTNAQAYNSNGWAIAAAAKPTLNVMSRSLPTLRMDLSFKGSLVECVRFCGSYYYFVYH